VGAAARLRERVAAECLAAREARQPLVLLLLGAEARDRLPDEADVDGHDPADRRVDLAELLDDERVGERVETAAPVAVAPAGSEVARVGEFRNERAVDLLGAVPVARVRRELALRELSRRGLDQLLFIAELEIHRCNLTHVPDLSGKVAIVTGAG